MEHSLSESLMVTAVTDIALLVCSVVLRLETMVSFVFWAVSVLFCPLFALMVWCGFGGVACRPSFIILLWQKLNTCVHI